MFSGVLSHYNGVPRITCVRGVNDRVATVDGIGSQNNSSNWVVAIMEGENIVIIDSLWERYQTCFTF